MKIKNGVDLTGMHPATIPMDTAVERAMAEITEPVITSGRDGKHKTGSLHYEGKAKDFRTNYLSPIAQAALRNRVKALLGKDYDVVLEPTHLHIEYDPKV